MRSYVNKVIVDSIPVDKRIKRSLTLKHRWLVEHNGPDFASDIFKDIRVAMLNFIASRDEEELMTSHAYSHVGARWLRRELMEKAKSQPHDVLQLLKLYTGLPRKHKDEYTARYNFLKQHRELLNSIGPAVITGEFARYLRGERPNYIRHALTRATHGMEGLILDDYAKYIPYTPDYKDRVIGQLGSPDSLWSEHQMFELRELTRMMFRNHNMPHIMIDAWPLFDLNLVQVHDDGTPFVVGEIQLRPKPGTTTYRPVGYLNRYLQFGLRPLADYLERTVRQLSNDATFDQNEFDERIQAKIDRGEFVASVDLSKATDYLPVDIFWNLMEGIELPDLVRQSYDLYRWVCDQEWLIGRWTASWKRGQALGTKPSFAVLALSHHAIMRYLCLALGKDPQESYVILGDDLLVFDKDLRDLYLKMVQALGVPISYHKSYEGNLAEFAGKMYVRNNSHRYNTDHKAITFESLFDYQTVTGIRISWDHLPHSLRKKWRQGFKSHGEARKWYEASSYYVTNRTPPDDYVAEVAALHLEDIFKVTEDEDLEIGVKYTVLGTRVIINPSHDAIKQPLDWYRKKVGVPKGSVIQTRILNALAEDTLMLPSAPGYPRPQVW